MKKESVRALTLFLSGECRDLEKMIEEKTRILETEREKTLRELSESIINVSPDKIENFVYKLKPFRRIPFRIHFSAKIQKKIDEIVLYLRDNCNAYNIADLKRYANDLMDFAFDDSIGLESRLMLAIMLHNDDDDLEWVIQVTSDSLANPNLTNEKDFLLLNLIAKHRLYIVKNWKMAFNETLIESKKAINKYSDDPRFHYLVGVITGRGIESGLIEEDICVA